MGGRPKISRFPLPPHFRYFSLSGNLLIEFLPRSRPWTTHIVRLGFSEVILHSTKKTQREREKRAKSGRWEKKSDILGSPGEGGPGRERSGRGGPGDGGSKSRGPGDWGTVQRGVKPHHFGLKEGYKNKPPLFSSGSKQQKEKKEKKTK